MPRLGVLQLSQNPSLPTERFASLQRAFPAVHVFAH
jgi:hypothetical protein